MEYEVDEFTDSGFSKSAARVFDQIDNGKYGVLPLSNYIDLIKNLGKVFVLSISWVICGKYTQMKVVVWTVLHF